MRSNSYVLMGILIVLFGSLGLCCLTPQFSNPQTTIPFDDTHRTTLPAGNTQTIPLVTDANLTTHYRDLNPELTATATNLMTTYNNKTLKETRSPTIFATWLAVETLGKVNHSVLMSPTIRDPTIQYLISTLNGSMVFHENLNYTTYMNVSDNNEDKFIFAPYTPTVIHQTALIALGKLSALSETFSRDQLVSWKAEILAGMHADGGFGTRIKDGMVQSTLVETYFAVASLVQLNLALNEIISSAYILNIQTYVKNHQSTFTVMPNPPEGCFYEYSAAASRGWTDFQIDWMACQIIDMIDANIVLFQDAFHTFLDTWEIFLPQDLCFVPTFNDRGSEGKYFYSGTYLLGDCIRILQLENNYPMTDIQAKVLGQFAQSKNFLGINISTERDISIQFFGAHYLNTSSIITSLSEATHTNLTMFLADFFMPTGGASFQNTEDLGLRGKAALFCYENQYNTLTSAQKTQMYWALNIHRTWKVSGTYYYFSDTNFNGTLWRRNFGHYDTLWNDYVESTYWAIYTLQQLGLLTTFYTVQGWQAYLNFEAWPKSQLLADGSFCNDSRFGVGDLQSTYYALETQRILIEFNTGQTFSTYYSTAELTRIRDYVMQYVHSNETHWWAEAPDLSMNTATLYTYAILKIVSLGDIVQEKLVTFVQEQIELPINIDSSLVTLTSRLQNALIDRAVKIIPMHAIISNYLALMNAQFLTPDSCNFLMFTQIGKSIRLLIAFMDYPIIHALYTAKPYSMMVCNWITSLPLTNLNLTGEHGTQFRTWSNTNGAYSALICPEYSPTDVQNWSWQVVFRANNIDYRVVGSTNLTYEFHVECIVTPSAMAVRITGSGSILDAISISALIKINATEFTIPTQMARDNGMITISETLLVMTNTTLAELIIRIWNAPSPTWNASKDQHAIECGALITLPIAPSNQSSPPSPSPSEGSNNTVLMPAAGIELDGSGVTMLFTAIGGCSVGATVFVKNAKTLRIVKKKQ